MKVRIKTRVVGQAFGCEAKVVAASNGRTLYESRTYPYGHDAQAYRNAESWAQAKGHRIEGEEHGQD